MLWLTLGVVGVSGLVSGLIVGIRIWRDAAFVAVVTANQTAGSVRAF